MVEIRFRSMTDCRRMGFNVGTGRDGVPMNTSRLSRQVEDALWNVTNVRQAPLGAALGHLRMRLPRLAIDDAGSPRATLRWTTEGESSSDPVDGALWEFLALDGTVVEDVFRLARRFGPLLWNPRGGNVEPEPGPERVEPAGARSSPAPGAAEEDVQTWAEPVSVWQAYARALATLYDLADSHLPVGPMNYEQRLHAIEAIAIPYWMADADLARHELTEMESGALVTEQVMGWQRVPSEMDADRLVSAALDAARVRPVFTSTRSPDPRPAYRIPAIERPLSGQPGTTAWHVQGLAPLLMVSLALALQTEERPRCTWCGKPAAIVTRRPQGNRPWYGDHAACRSLARVKTMNQAEDKRAEKRRRRRRGGDPGAAEHDPAGPQSTVHDPTGE
jgi:hypothetical protein